MPGSGTELREFLAQAGLRETGAMDDVAQAARDAATVLEVMTCISRGGRESRGRVFTHCSSEYGMGWDGMAWDVGRDGTVCHGAVRYGTDR